MAGRLLSHDSMTGITSLFHYDAATDTAIIEKKQDVQSILDMNKIERNAGMNNKERGLGKKVATIPLVLYYKWKNECKAKGLDHNETNAFIMAQLRSRDYCHLLTVDKI